MKPSTTSTAAKAGGTAARTWARTTAARLQPKRGYFPTPPTDTLQDVRSRIVLALEGAGVPIEIHHHEVATAGQGEIDMRFDTLTRMADSVMIYKYMVKNVARQNGLTATFMPKPLFGDNGSGMHCPSEHLEGREERVLRRSRLRAALRHRQVLHRRPAEACVGPAGAVLRRPPIHIAVLCPALRRPSTWPIHSAIARPSAASRSAPGAPSQSALSSARPIRRQPLPVLLRPC